MPFLNSDHAMASIVEIDRVVRESRFDGVPSRLSEKGLNAPGDHFPWPYLIDHQWLQFILYPRARLVRPRRKGCFRSTRRFSIELVHCEPRCFHGCVFAREPSVEYGREDFFFRFQLIDREILMLCIDAID